MKKILLTLVVAITSYCSHAQTNTFPSTGNVGIGTTSPGNKLDIYSNNERMHIGNGSADMYFGQWDNITNRIESSSRPLYFTTYTGAINFGISGATNLSVANSGNVGIGTTSPLEKLHVAGAIRSTSNAIDFSTSDGMNMDYYPGGIIGRLVAINNTGTAALGLYTGNGEEKVRITSNGNVGIGTTAPGYKIDIFNAESMLYSPTTANASLRVYNPSATDNAFSGVELAGQNGSSEYGSTKIGSVSKSGYSADFVIQQRNAGTYQENLRVLSNGDVGIGTSDPHGYKLAVNGNAIATSMTVKLYANWPDYVFKNGYQLPSLADVKTYIDKNQHLPDMPSEQEVVKNGINLGEIVKVQTKKIEELTLYAIDQEKRIATLEAALLKLTANSK